MDDLKNLTLKQANEMRKIYTTQENKIKKMLEQALIKGNDTTYLKKLLANIEDEIKILDSYFYSFSQVNLPLIWQEGIKRTDEAINAFEANFNLEKSFGQVNTRAIKILADNTYNGLHTVSVNIGRMSNDFIREIGLKQARGVVFGSDTWKQASKQMSAELKANNFFSVTYKNGSKIPSGAYSEMVARTTPAKAFREATFERITGRGYDLIDVIGISADPKSPCVPYQGKTLSITGKTKGFTSYEEATANGYNHPNCIHTNVFSPKNKELMININQ